MNFINDLAKYRFIFFISVISGLSFIQLNSQVSHFTPYLKAYPFFYDEGRCTPPSDFFIDKVGLVYISVPNTIIISNGNKEQKISADGFIRFSKGLNKILIFNQSFAGYIQQDSLGHFSLFSYKTQMPELFSGLSNISDFQSAGDTLFIIAKPNLYRIVGNTYEIIDDSFFSGKLLTVNNSLLVFKAGSGIKKAGDDEYLPLSSSDFIPDFAIKHPKGFLFYSGFNNKYLGLSENLNSEFHWNPFFIEKVFSADSDGQKFFFYTDDHNFQITDINGNKDPIYTQISLGTHFQVKKTILRKSKLWYIQNNSLWYIDLPPVIFKANIIPQSFTRSLVTRNGLEYIGGIDGLFVSGRENQWTKISSDAVISIISNESNLIIHNKDGILLQSSQGSFPIYTGEVMSCRFDELSNILYFSIPGKILSCQLSQNTLAIPEILLNGVNAVILTVVKDKLWFSDGFSTGTYQLNTSVAEKPEFISLLTDKLIDIFSVNDSVFLMTKKNVYRFNEGVFTPFLSVSKLNTHSEFYKFIQCSLNSNWLILNNHSFGYTLYHSKDFQNFRHVYHSQFDKLYPPVISQSNNNLYRIVSGESVFNFILPDDNINKTQNIFINSIISGIDTLFNGLGVNSLTSSIPEVKADRKKIKINLSTDDFGKNPISYRYEIHNRRLYISDWVSSGEIELSKLKWGNNTVTIFSSNDTRFANGSIVLSIKILKPVYLRSWVILLVFITIFILAFIAYKTFIFNSLSTHPASLTPSASANIKNEPFQSDIFAYHSKPVPYDKSKWEKFELTTVLFSDIQGFTKIAEQMNPELLIDELDKFFFHFDSVCEKYNIEKIKTIGDAYMAAGGIPKQNNTNPIEVVLAALEMQLYMKQLRNSRTDIWDLRIGIHSGPVIGGVIGHKKRSYDIWGDTVNTASRMESSGEAGKVNISGTTYSLIKDYFICTYRGRLPVKYKGNIDMYFVKGLRPELSINLGTLPNRVFYLKIQHLKLKELEIEIINRLEVELNEKYCFHTIEYIRKLYTLTSDISLSERISIEDELIVKTAVLLLYTGLPYSYNDFHNKSASIAEDILPAYKYNKKQVFAVTNLIQFSRLNRKPQTITEEIIHDVITDYMGKPDFDSICWLLYKEQNEFLDKVNTETWVQKQIMNLKVHRFFTNTSQPLREKDSEQQIISLQNADWK
jgi:adenylate cyclase